MLSRRAIIGVASGLALAPVWRRAGLAEEAPLSPGLPAGTAREAALDALPGKRPLIKLTYRPPNYETPIDYFRQTITPNDAFFVRYHNADIPEVKVESWRLSVGGEAVERPQSWTLDELRQRFEPVELVAVCQCSGNRRGLADPHVAGVEWGYGAMGNARWTGVRLKDLLAAAGLKPEAVEVAFDGADRGAAPGVPDFVKSLPAWRALDDSTLVAYRMNGEPLPRWNGFPARLVVPGWTGTYWVKHLTTVEARTRPLANFWMRPAYRLPRRMFPLIERFTTQEDDRTTPITEMVVNSLITSHRPGDRLAAGRPAEVTGIAWDGGYGIDAVAVSTDGGRTWRAAGLDEDLGRFSFRSFRFPFTPEPGPVIVMAEASNLAGQGQVPRALWNGAGYHHNVVQTLELVAA
jgi:sulfite dehydrogenase